MVTRRAPLPHGRLPLRYCQRAIVLAAVKMLWGGSGGDVSIAALTTSRWSPTMTKHKTETVNDLSRCLDPLDMDATLIVVIEMSQSSWLVAGIVPGVERQPLKKLAIDERALLNLLSRWRAEAEKKGHRITRIAVAFEAGHDGFWLARWLAAQGVEPHVIHSSSVAVTREHRRAKTDRLDTELLKRGFLGWLRGERGHCKMVAVPTLAEEDAKRPSRERETLVGEASRIITRVKAAFVRLGIRSFNPKLKAAAERLGTLRTPEGEPIPPNTLAALKRDLERHQIIKRQIREIEQTRLDHLAQAPAKGPHAMVLLLARVVGIGVETADMLVQEVLSRNMRDRRGSALCRSHRLARRKRGETPGEGIGPLGQSARSPRHDPAGMAVPHVPEGQRTRRMVSAANGECPVDAQDVCCGVGAQAADRALAPRARRRRARRCAAASRCMIDETR